MSAHPHLYLSPHLDDVAYSCAGEIHQRVGRGEGVLVFTLMAGDPPEGPLSRLARRIHRAWEKTQGDGQTEAPGGIPARRRAEDRAALGALGADLHHGAWPEALYRRDPGTGAALYPTFGALFGSLHPVDEARIPPLVDALRGLGPVASITAPLGVGRHVDHRILHRAALMAFGSACICYEDYPYAAEPEALAGIAEAGWIPAPIPLSEADLRARIAAIQAYPSQLQSFWRDAQEAEDALRRALARAGGEGRWRPPEGA